MKNQIQAVLGAVKNKVKNHPETSLLRISDLLSYFFNQTASHTKMGDLELQPLKVVQGFTLIELLVVILIIGILSAIALPQYQKTVQRVRNTELKQLARAIVTAEQAYYLANGKYAGNFDELDIDLPLTPKATTVGGYAGACSLLVQGTDAVRKGKDFAVVLNSSDLSSKISVVAVYTQGTYNCIGFVIRLTAPSDTQCAGSISLSDEGARKKFCEQIEQGTYLATSGGWDKYSLP